VLAELLGAHEIALTFTKGGEEKVVCHCGATTPPACRELRAEPPTAARDSTVAAASAAAGTLRTVGTATSSATQEGD
jgi:hypothetical protein